MIFWVSVPFTFANNELENNDDEELEDNTHEPGKVEAAEGTALTENNIEESTVENHEQVTDASNKIAYFTKPDKDTANNVKKGVIGEKKKPTVTSTSVNAIHDHEKPVKKPIKNGNTNENNNDDDILDDDDEDDEVDDDEDDEIDDDDDKDDEDENEEDEDKIEDEKDEEHDYDEDEKDLADLDDDDDEEEEAVFNAFMETGKSKKDKGNAKNQTSTDEDYSVEFLARKRHPRSESRQSKIMRF